MGALAEKILSTLSQYYFIPINSFQKFSTIKNTFAFCVHFIVIFSYFATLLILNCFQKMKLLFCLAVAFLLWMAVCGRPIQIGSDEELTAESVERVATVGDAGSGNRMRRSIPIFCPFGTHDCFDHLPDHPRPLVTTEAPTTEPAWLRIQDRLLNPPTTSTSTTEEPTTTTDLWEEIWEAFTEETWL